MTKAKLISVAVEDRPGTVAATISSLADAKISVLSVFGWAPQGILQLVVDNPEAAVDVLKQHGIAFEEGEAEVVEMADKPGMLHAYLTELANDGVNLRSLSGFGGGNGERSYVIWTAEK
jgi:hypothetical protein